jgi:predicted metal-dependent hydrolase
LRTWLGAWWTLHVARQPVVEQGNITFGATTIPYSIRRSRRRKKTIEITLDPSEGVLVSAPVTTRSADVALVVQRRAGWIVRKGTDRMLHPRPKQFVSGESIPYLGRQVRLFVEHAEVGRVQVQFDHWSFRIKVPSGLTGDHRRTAVLRAAQAWYRRRAQVRLQVRTERWARTLGWDCPQVLVRDQRQRWGSCGRDGTIRFNWRAIMAEPALIDYIVVHELLHLRHRTHGRDFWGQMGSLMPDFGARRVRLKEFGTTLAI